MQRRITILFFLTAVFLILSGTFLFGVPQSTTKIFKTPLIHKAYEESASGGIQSDGKSVSVETDTSKKPIQPPVKPHVEDIEINSAPAYTGPLHVTITETGGSHDEVVAALVHSFGSQREAIIDLYQLLPRFGIINVMNSFSLANRLPKPKTPQIFQDEGYKARRPDVFVAGTCELDIVKFKDQLAVLLSEGKTYMFCVIHHADRWADPSLGLEDAIRPWVEKGMVEFWSLSPHTAKFLKDQSIGKWKTTASGTEALVRHFVPVFPVMLPAQPQGNGQDKEELSFGLQGDYDPARRHYSSIFHRLSSFLKSEGSSASSAKSLDESNNRNVTMHLLGHGTHPDVPDDIRDHVKFDERLDYIDYYSIISRTFALLPAFASNEYLDRKASSSVPAALIGGTPLVATQDIIDAYSYLNKDVVWLQEKDETDLDVVGRILDMGPKERRKKKELVRKRCAEIVEANTKRVEQWINRAMQKIQKH